MRDVAQWLDGLGFGQYAQTFVDNDIDLEVLPDLGEADLEKLGVSLGHRKKLLRAIAERVAESAAPAAIPTTGAERRHLTVLFCDLVGSTALAQRLDPEDLRWVMRGYQDAVAGAVTRHGGHVAKYLGDGVLAYFGWPQAYEDQAERAVRAGLDAVGAVARVAVQKASLQARVGIATGAVVVGDLVGAAGREADAVSGETPNLAFRLQAGAGPGEVHIGPETRRLLGQTFEFQELGRRDLKGFAEPVPVWRVLGEGRVASRFEASHGAALTRFVGREQEVALLLERWRRAKDGEGQVVLLSGEPGIGKSRILQALSKRIGAEAHTRLRYQCAPYYTSGALHPVIAQLERACGFRGTDSVDLKLDKLESLLHASLDDLASAAPLFAAMLSLPYEDRYGKLRLTPQQQKTRTFDALIELLLGLAHVRPVLFLFEDAHWIDPTTQELLDLTMERIRDARVLMVLTHRPDFASPWRGHSHITALALSRLTRAQCSEIVDHLAGGRALSDEVRAQIVDKTDGVPLFVEELTKAVLESDLLVEGDHGYTLAGPLAPLAVPATLQDSLMARLDRLGPVKELAQIGAVIGREFSHELIAAVAPHDGAELNQALDQLVASELVFRRGTPANPLYVFKHALVQDTAYESLLKSRRQELHARIARALEPRDDTAPELLAHHFTEAGLKEEALVYWQKAGERAAQQSSNAEAVAHLKRGLDVLAELPADPSRDQREFQLLIKSGPALMGSLGWSDPAVRETYERAQTLCRGSDRLADMFTATWGLWMHAQARSEHRDAEAIAKTLLASAEQAGDTELLLQARHAAWTTCLYTGRLVEACDHVERGLALYDADAHGHHALIYAGHDPGVCGHCQRAVALWLRGYPDQARESNRQGQVLAQALNHPPTIAHASHFAARLGTMLRDLKSTAAYADKAIAIGQEKGLPISVFQASIARGWVRVQDGDGEAGLAQIGKAHAWRVTSEHRSAAPQYLGLFADAYLALGQLQSADREIAEALRLAAETGERVWEPELLRLRGEIRRRQGDAGEAEAQMRAALDLAIEQGAKSLELRAATSLARLWAEKGQRQQAAELLGPVYDWFIEGFDTPDLTDAKALRDELG